MKRSFMSIMKFSLIAMSLAGLMYVAACSEDDTVVPTETIYSLIESTDNLDSLKKYLDVYPDLVSALDAAGVYTFFAPNNAAFISLLQTPGFPADIRDISPDLIELVLSYHVVPGSIIKSGDLGPDMSTLITPLNSADVIKVNSDGSLLTGATNPSIMVVQADVEGTNGVMHVTGSVLIPQSVGAQLTPLLGKIGGTVMLGADFTNLASLVTLADSDVPSGMLPVLAYMTSATGTPVEGASFTLFGVPNAVFTGAAAQAGVTVEQFLGTFNAASARATLLNHMIEGTVSSTTLGGGGQYTSLAGNTLTIGTDPDSGAIVINASVPLVPGNTDLPASNGVVHVIGGIIQ